MPDSLDIYRLNKRMLKHSVDVQTALQTLSSDATQNMSTLLVYIFILPSRCCKILNTRTNPYIFFSLPSYFSFCFVVTLCPCPVPSYFVVLKCADSLIQNSNEMITKHSFGILTAIHAPSV